MTKLACFAVLVLVLPQICSADDLTVDVLSFNIRYGTARDGEDAWPERKGLVFDVIRSEQADFVGLQEALRFQIDEIRKAVPGYDESGVGRDDGKTAGEYSSILYREERWKLDRGETLWYSDTPHRPGSTGWGNSIPRIVSWARFEEKTIGRSVYVFNTHFDHQSQPSRLKAAEFLKARVAEIAGDAPVIVMGDFNAGESNPAIVHLKDKGDAGPALVDTFRVLHPDAEKVGTFNGFEGRTDGDKIDYIFARSTAKVKDAEILHTNREGRYPSDHFPVRTQVVLPATD